MSGFKTIGAVSKKGFNLHQAEIHFLSRRDTKMEFHLTTQNADSISITIGEPRLQENRSSSQQFREFLKLGWFLVIIICVIGIIIGMHSIITQHENNETTTTKSSTTTTGITITTTETLVSSTTEAAATTTTEKTTTTTEATTITTTENDIWNPAK